MGLYFSDVNNDGALDGTDYDIIDDLQMENEPDSLADTAAEGRITQGVNEIRAEMRDSFEQEGCHIRIE